MGSIRSSKLYRKSVAIYGRCLSVRNGAGRRYGVLSLSLSVGAFQWSL
jgi:hypothetical protein